MTVPGEIVPHWVCITPSSMGHLLITLRIGEGFCLAFVYVFICDYYVFCFGFEVVISSHLHKGILTSVLRLDIDA